MFVFGKPLRFKANPGREMLYLEARPYYQISAGYNTSAPETLPKGERRERPCWMKEKEKGSNISMDCKVDRCGAE